MPRNTLLRTRTGRSRDPFQRMFDTAFDRGALGGLLGGSIFDDVEAMLGQVSERSTAAPRVNAYRTDDAYHLVLEVPGLTADKLQIEARDGGLDLRAEVDTALPEGATLLRRERPATLRIERRYTFAEDADLEQTRATLDNGLLTLTVPRSHPTTRRIEVEVG